MYTVTRATLYTLRWDGVMGIGWLRVGMGGQEVCAIQPFFASLWGDGQGLSEGVRAELVSSDVY